MKSFTAARGGLGELRRALFVYNMNVYKPRVKTKTKERHAEELIAACRKLVQEHETAEAYRWMLLTTPLTTLDAQRQGLI